MAEYPAHSARDRPYVIDPSIIWINADSFDILSHPEYGDPFVETNKIGDSELSNVYRAVYVPLDKKVAVKCYSTLHRRREYVSIQDDNKNNKVHMVGIDFYREIATLATCHDSERVVKLLGVFISTENLARPRQFLILELLDGDLRQFTRSQQSVDWSTRLSLIRETILTLKSFHDLKLMHRDIKPANFLVYQRSDNKLGIILCDFGSSVTMERKLPDNCLVTNLPVSAHYHDASRKPGEVYRLCHELYSLGVVLYELLKCKKPELKSFSNRLTKRKGSLKFGRFSSFFRSANHLKSLRIKYEIIWCCLQHEISNIEQCEAKLEQIVAPS